ncbi:MAG: hypothetical protein ACE5GX_03655 [Thermoanaerobaculia bacterium]
MSSHLTSPTFFWRSCGEPSAAWFLVWMPLVLLALENTPSLASAMARLLAVLLVAGLIWARGLGPVGPWPARLFVSAWAAVWAAALGLLVTAGGWPITRLGSIALGTALLVGAAWLGWACQVRHDLRKALAAGPRFGVSPDRAANTSTIAVVWLLSAALFTFAIIAGNAHWADGLVIALALGAFTAFQLGSLAQSEVTTD